MGETRVKDMDQRRLFTIETSHLASCQGLFTPVHCTYFGPKNATAILINSLLFCPVLRKCNNNRRNDSLLPISLGSPSHRQV